MSCEKSGAAASAQPLLVVISGPSGVGKDATLARMKEAGLLFHYVVTVTTRPKRPSEQDSVDYHFLSEDEFHQKIQSEDLLEWAEVYGNYYGVPKKEIQQALRQGQDVIVKVDVQGAATIKQVLPNAILVFLMPPSKEELGNRLKKRQSQPLAELNLRLNKAQEEIESLSIFDYVVVSHKNQLDVTVSEIIAIVTAEKCRVQPRLVSL